MARELSGARRYLIYALGGGRGHVTRAATLAREMAAPSLLLVPESLANLASELGAPRVLPLREQTPMELATAVRDLVHAFAATDLIADVFPEGILDELPSVLGEVRRSIAVVRLRRDALSERFTQALRRYTHCIDIEPQLGWLPEPRGPELTRFGPVARTLGPSAVGTHSPDVLLVASEVEQHAFLERLALRLTAFDCTTRLVRDGASLSHADLAARVCVGPAGYNLTYELMRAGTWHLALPASRRFDDQGRRARVFCDVCASPSALERRVLALLTHATRRSAACAVQPISELAAWIAGISSDQR